MSNLTTTNKSEALLIELFEKYGDQSNEVRKTAIDQFAKIGLPGKKAEEYKFTPFDKVLEEVFEQSDLQVSELTSDQISDFFNKEAGSHLVFVDGVYQQQLSQIQSQQGVSIASSSDLAALNQVADAADAFTSINTAFVADYASIKVERNVTSLPVFIYHFVDASKANISNLRLIVEAAEGSKIELAEKTWVDGEASTFLNPVVEINVAQNASVNYTKLQNHGKNVIIHDGLKVNQARDSRFYANTFTFSGQQIRNNLDISLNDQNCETHMHGLYLLNGKSHVDNHTSVDHKIENCYSNEVYKGIVADFSHAVFNGKIFVRPNAQQTNAFQSNNNISLSDTATINTKPQLEIWADDVKCSHGCTIGQMDKEALFYLKARGLDERSAKSMLLIAFAEDTFEYIPFEFLKEEIDEIITTRLS